jgi:hypothetical protein
MTGFKWQNEPDLDETRQLYAMLSATRDEALVESTASAVHGSVNLARRATKFSTPVANLQREVSIKRLIRG